VRRRHRGRQRLEHRDRALIIVVLNNGLVILGVPSEIQQIVQGAILVLAVLVALDRSKIGVIK
jgi:ribose/xylose/arabinose/galactoside ABC-type transport system permease subunit